ncbi:hypothetical protein FRC02_010857 [Tulasnella sp. 418]|nr:hypothetical protein FRC02_010857 [Tulasnella sp. 418]
MSFYPRKGQRRIGSRSVLGRYGFHLLILIGMRNDLYISLTGRDSMGTMVSVLQLMMDYAPNPFDYHRILTIQILPQASGRQQTTYSTAQPTFRRTAAPSLPSPTPLNSILMQILTHVSSKHGREAVPLIVTSNSISPFPLRIDIRAGEA